MYPQHYFGLFPPFPRRKKVFVAMSFDEKFRTRWENVIVPAIQSVQVDGTALEPHRVDTRQIGDSVLTEILEGIANDMVILADVTTIGCINGTAIRNGNVMYEVGIAHAVRLPEEVLLFRSDSDSLPFDLANIRVNSYNPDEAPEPAKQRVEEALISAINEVNIRKHLAVEDAAKSLDHIECSVLDQAFTSGGVRPFPTQTMGNALANTPRNMAITRLLQFGLLEVELETRMRKIFEAGAVKDQIHEAREGGLFTYKLTHFGNAVHKYFWGHATELGLVVAVDTKIRQAKRRAQSNATHDSGQPSGE